MKLVFRPVRRTPEEIRVPHGFTFATVIAGIKPSGRPDLTFAEVGQGATAAALFTRNRVAAAPVEVGRANLKSSKGRIRAVLINSGNANCATGPAGKTACQLVCKEAARALGFRAKEVFPSSTGIIGVPLPTQKIVAKLPELFAARSSSEASARAFANAILTTDTRSKAASVQVKIAGQLTTILGMAKGSGMIHPKMATMLAYIFTDIAASAADLHRLLRTTTDSTFNCISVDGDTSTNDTVLLIASGKSDAKLNASTRPRFSQALHAVCASLAEQIVSDGEGATHIIHLDIEQARNREEALQIARAISHSPLVKTAWAGADPNWGRILAAIGNSGVPVDPARVKIHIGDQEVCRNGAFHPFDEARAHQSLSQPDCSIRVQLRRGKTNLQFLTTDLTTEYVHINADYST
jgi:glutamate N-acetyltransferase / amino-acid N-acetyltransferase